jgi:chorismate mutase
LEAIMTMRGIRGATTVKQDQADLVMQATRNLLESIQQLNPGLRPMDIASVFFTTTADLTSVHPALAAREMGWTTVPMMCAQEIPVPGSLPLCIRVLIHWNTACEQIDIQHVYLHEAKKLRPDLVQE